MKTLIVGGTGFVGGYTALYFKKLGHDVTIMGRSRPKGNTELDALSFIQGNYVEDNFDDGRLEGFDSMVFSAGNDLGNYREHDKSLSQADYFEKTNIIGLPRFFEQAKQAGISRTVYMGSFYSFVAPDSIESVPYVWSRHLADEAVRKLSSPGFNVCSCALPWIVGHIPGFPVAHWQALARYAQGDLGGFPEFAPPGGANFMSCRSVAEAMLGGLERGESGKSYLIGDVNLSWKEFFELWFQAAGRPRNLEVRDDEHLIIPKEVLAYLGGKGTDYVPPANETALLGYQQGQIPAIVEECQRYYGGLTHK